MAITCFIRYRIDPFQRAAFEAYARRWQIIPRCGAGLIAYFLRHEGTSDIASGSSPPILAEERTFLENVGAP